MKIVTFQRHYEGKTFNFMKGSLSLEVKPEIRSNHEHRLLIIPGSCQSLGGTLTSLSSLIAGFVECGAGEQLCVLVQAGSLMEQYLTAEGQHFCLQPIPSRDTKEFVARALHWVNQQPKDFPLLLDNCVAREVLPALALAAPSLRWSDRPIYHFCHDLALSHNHLGFLMRKLTFWLLYPQAVCNSYFTAQHIRRFMNDVRGVFYQPVDLKRFNSSSPTGAPPDALKPIIHSGARIILTPSRITKAGIVNDKNLRSLIPVLAHLRCAGHHYHVVVIGEDDTPELLEVRALQEAVQEAGIADWFTILPPIFEIEQYYKYADVVVTLAPREPFGRIVVEAIACGVPVVGSRTGGIGEILSNFAPEWMVDPNDPIAAAETILRVADDPQTPRILARGQEWVGTECNTTDYALQIMELTGITPRSPISTAV